MYKKCILVLFIIATVAACADGNDYNLKTKELAKSFTQPPVLYGPYVWWHWMGSNFSKDGIKKDLEAMRESGIAGATIFNIASAVQESHYPIENNPWPEQTYRSNAYWEALEYAAATALELGMKIGLHNSPGYSTAGGPWVTEEKGMQKVVKSRTDIIGGKAVKIKLPMPNLPVYDGWGGPMGPGSFYEDIAVLAIPEGKNISADKVTELTDKMSPDGTVDWNAPAGKWHIFRIGHAPTMSCPHPLPDDLIGKVLESDKMTASSAAFHWDNVLGPLKEHLGGYFGKSFTHILIDSYEAGDQDWGEGFRDVFKNMHGYDPMCAMAIKELDPECSVAKKFDEDNKATISRMYLDNGFTTARDKINDAGLLFYWEPYSGPFDTAEGCSLSDQPMGEFWTGGNGRISKDVVENARKYGKRIVGAEAFTGRPENSHYTEDPEFLKKSADGAFASGANRLFLHHWVHQPFDDRYQPGMGMGWWGTHFGRNQTWFEPGKEFFRYLTRCQMLLQQGDMIDYGDNWIHRKSDAADIYFVVNQTKDTTVTQISSEDSRINPEFWDPYKAMITAAESSSDGKSSTVDVELAPGQSVFVLFNHNKPGYKKAPVAKVTHSIENIIEGTWDIRFSPKLDKEFTLKDQTLKDFSTSSEEKIKYFSGTAIYTKNIELSSCNLGKNKKVIIDLGGLNDIVDITINGKHVGVLWYPPYKTDITDFVKPGTNKLEIAVTNNWANRLIGDEQYDSDFEWGRDRGESMGRAMKRFPDWFLKEGDRPSKNRKGFIIWSYFRANTPLEPAGLVGPVKLNCQDVTYEQNQTHGGIGRNHHLITERISADDNLRFSFGERFCSRHHGRSIWLPRGSTGRGRKD